jgi:hypothetical protein
MRILLGLLFCAALMAPPAMAQTPADPLLQHYRAYRAALDQRDLVTAEAEAQQALAVSAARDGDGGRTGVLSLNLATVRLMRNDAAGAIEPAERALSLAQAGAAGVEPEFAELILGRAELVTSGQPGADRLARLLASDRLRNVAPAEEIFPAATQLGRWAIVNRQPTMAREAWAAAGANASGSVYGETYGAAASRTWEAASMIMEDLGYEGRRRRMDVDVAYQAYGMLTEAFWALRPLALEEAPSMELTVAQRAYAETMAWQAIVRAKLSSDGQRLPREYAEAQGDADGMSELGAAGAAPRCWTRLMARPLPEFPGDALNRGQLGAVVVRLRLDPTGHVTEHEVVAYAGRGGFTEAVERVASRWRVVRRDDSPANCRMPGSLLAPVTFMLG